MTLNHSRMSFAKHIMIALAASTKEGSFILQIKKLFSFLYLIEKRGNNNEKKDSKPTDQNMIYLLLSI